MISATKIRNPPVYEPALCRAFMCNHLGFEPLCLPTMKGFRAIICLSYWHMPNPHSLAQNWAWERGVGISHSSKRDGLKTEEESQPSLKPHVSHFAIFLLLYRLGGGGVDQESLCLYTTQTCKLSDKKSKRN